MSPSTSRNRFHCEVLAGAGGEIVEADDLLIQFEQGFEQIRADETGGAGHEPGAGRGFQAGFEFFVCGH